ESDFERRVRNHVADYYEKEEGADENDSCQRDSSTKVRLYACAGVHVHRDVIWDTELETVSNSSHLVTPNGLRLRRARPMPPRDPASREPNGIGKAARARCSGGLGGTCPSRASTASTAPSRRYVECDRHDEYKTSECLGEPILKSDGERHHRSEDAPL